jgi:hypothetical protein
MVSMVFPQDFGGLPPRATDMENLAAMGEPTRRPKMTPYDRASQRELVRMSVEYELHPDVYRNRRISA